MSKNELNVDQYKTIAQDVIDYAKKNGASDVELDMSFTKGFSVEVRKQAIDQVDFDRAKSLGITVYVGKKRGSASISDFSQKEIEKAIDAALGFAKYVANDPYSSLPDSSELAFNYSDIDVYHPWDITTEQAISIASECEALALENKHIDQSEGVSLSTHESYSLFANSLGFMGECYSSSHDIGCSVIAKRGDIMERESEYTSGCHVDQLWSIEHIAKESARKAIARLGSRKIKTKTTPVIFADYCASSVLGNMLSAIRGSNIFKKTSFLLDSLDKPIMPSFITLKENPHVKRDLSSDAFDGEGVRTRPNIFVEDGVLRSYILSTYSANQLKLKTTGNAGGVNNLQVSHSDISFDDLVSQMHKGLIVTEMMGQGVNMVTGDFSQGASGFWVEHGEIQYPVSEITIAGNLKDMLQNIQAIADNIDPRLNIKTGSILIDGMVVGG